MTRGSGHSATTDRAGRSPRRAPGRRRGAGLGLALAAALGAAALAPSGARAQARPAGVRGLPREFEYQKQLCTWLATLTARDFEPPQGTPITVAPDPDPDTQFRLWVLSLDPVRIGNKRCPPSVNLPANQFTLGFIESPADQTVIQPLAWAEPLAWLANWDYAGNPYRGSKALKLRAFVLAAQDLMMVDEQQEHTDAPMWRRADWFAPHLLMYAYTYAAVRDELPEGARKAFEAGLAKMVRRVDGWGPRGDETYLDIQAALAMTILYGAMDDADLKPVMEGYVRRFMTPGEFYSPAGYFADQGCFDPGFNGLTLFYATWLALRAPPEWTWAREAVAQAWKLRGYLMLPEPDDDPALAEKRLLFSPTHMTLRTGSAVCYDQWNWPFKFVAAAYLTDDALCQVRWPSADELRSGPESAVGGLMGNLNQNPQDPRPGVAHNVFLKNEELGILPTSPWTWRLFPGSPVFPMINYGADHYPKGFAARLAGLQAAKSPLLELPFRRSGSFIERFDKSFVVAKVGGYGAIIHTGPVSGLSDKEVFKWPGAPYGLSGGTLSAFWTPAAGSLILGRRGGMSNPGGQPVCFDKPAEWRNWPVHAVIGSTGGDHFFTSARIRSPDTTCEVAGDRATITVSGVIPPAPLDADRALQGRLDYARSFRLAPDGVRIETRVAGDGADMLTELYEVIPALHRDYHQGTGVTARIEFRQGGAWVAASPALAENVTAIRITRFNGAAIVTLDRARRVKLSPGETSEGFLTGGVSRNILIDLLENSDKPAAIKEAKSVSYRIEPAGRQG